MQLILSRLSKIFCYIILFFFIVPFLSAQELHVSCGTQDDLSVSLTVPAHVSGHNEINCVTVWINITPVDAVDAGTTFSLLSPHGTTPSGFDNDGIERNLFDPDFSTGWLISLTPYITGTILRIKRDGMGDTRINETDAGQIWVLTLSDFSRETELISLDITTRSKTWKNSGYNDLSSPNYLAFISTNPCNHPPEITSLGITDRPVPGPGIPGIEISPADPYTVTFRVIAHDDCDCFLLYDWEFTPDPGRYSGESVDDTKTVDFTNDGDYTIRVRAKDDEGAYSPYSSLFLPLHTPHISIQANPGTGQAPLTVDLSINGPPATWDDGTLVETIWNFGESTPPVHGYFPGISYTYTSRGNYTPYLTVVDNTNLQARTTYPGTIIVSGDSTLPSVTFYAPEPPADPVDFDAGDTYKMHFTAVGADPDGDDADLTCVWDFFGQNIASPEPGDDADQDRRVIYTEPGTYNVSVYVTDRDGNSSNPVQQTIYLWPPNPDFSFHPGSGREPVTVMFTNSSTDDPNSSIVTYEWDYNGTGQPEETIMGHFITHIHDFTRGSYAVTLTAIDSMNLKTVTSPPLSLTVDPPNNDPVISGDITINYESGNFEDVPDGSTFTTRCTVSAIDPDSDPLDYSWYFNGIHDGTQVSSTATHTWSSTGVYNVSVTVEDNYGGAAGVEQTFSVVPPLSRFSINPPEGQTGVPITFTNESIADNGSIIQANLEIDDNAAFDSPLPPLDLLVSSQTHIFDLPGTYYARLNVRDNMNIPAASEPVLINIRPPPAGNPPVITSLHYVIPETPAYLDSYTLRFTANAVDDCGCALSCRFDLQPDNSRIDLSSQSGVACTTDPVPVSNPADYTVSLTVKDDAGNTSEMSRSFTVYEPTVEIAPVGAVSGPAPCVFTFNQVSSDFHPGEAGYIKEYFWVFDHQTNDTFDHIVPSVNLPSFSHELTGVGNWKVMLRIVDNMNVMTDSHPVSITVEEPNNAPSIAGDSINVKWHSGNFNSGDYQLVFEVILSDPDENNLTCTWEIDGMELPPDTAVFPAYTTGYSFPFGPFITTGEHHVHLTVDDGCGGRDYAFKTFTLKPPSVHLEAVPGDGPVHMEGTVTAGVETYSGAIESVTWYIDDMIVSTNIADISIPFFFTQRGMHTIRFTVMDEMHLEGTGDALIRAYKPAKEVVLVVDHSDSMNDGIKWPAATSAINLFSEILNYLHTPTGIISEDDPYNPDNNPYNAHYMDYYQELDQMGIVSYTSTTGGLYNWDWGTPADAINTWPDTTDDGTSLAPMPVIIPDNWEFPGGFHWTPTGEGLTRAIKLFEGEGTLPDGTPGTDREKYIILLTDGQNNAGTEELSEYAELRTHHPNPAVRSHTVYTIVAGDDTHSWPGQIDEVSSLSGGEFRVADDPVHMFRFFLEVLGQEIPVDLITPDTVGMDEKWAEFTIDQNNRIFFAAVWENVPGNGPYALQATREFDGDGASDGTIITPSDIDSYDNVFASRHIDNYAFFVIDNTITGGNTMDMTGKWSIDLVTLDGFSVMDTVNAQYFAIVDVNLDAEFEIDKKIHGTGDEIILTASIKEFGKPVTGATVQANVTFPREGAGETMSQCIFSGSGQPESDSKSIMYHHLQAAWQKKQRYALLTGNSTILLNDDGMGKDKTAGDGIYTAVFDQLEYEGNYTFQFTATGKNSLNQAFKRTETVSSFVRCRVDSAASEWHYRVNPDLVDANVKEVIVFFEPKDKYGRHFGPYLDSHITFDVRGGKPDPVFHYDADHKYGTGGVYYQRILFNEWVNVPDITIKVRDQVIAKDIVVRTFNALDLSLYGGTFLLDSQLEIFRNPLPFTLGLRLTINPVRVVGIEADISISGYDINPSRDLVLQASGNLILNMGSFVNLGKVIYPYFAAGAGILYLNGFDVDDYFFTINTGVGGKYDITQFLQLRLDGRYFLAFDLMDMAQTHNIQLTAGLVIGF